MHPVSKAVGQQICLCWHHPHSRRGSVEHIRYVLTCGCGVWGGTSTPRFSRQGARAGRPGGIVAE